jgi:hypothetical protein
VRVTNGHGLGTEISYKPLSDSSAYTRGSGSVYPVQDLTPDQLVVSSVKVDNGIGGKNEQTHSYSARRTHVLGVGDLGFAGMVLRDLPTGIRTETVYFAGLDAAPSRAVATEPDHYLEQYCSKG